MILARSLHPSVEPYAVHRIRVSDLHEIYVEECGDPQAPAVLTVHGGPGAGTNPLMRRFFDPRRHRVILFDQRGCGRSTPTAEVRENTTWDLVADMETIRRKLGVERWALFGGSWGSTLALAYAQAHPERVRAMILRGIFLVRKSELDWFYGGGAAHVWPDLWARLIEPIPHEERHDLVTAYYRRLMGPDSPERRLCAHLWGQWEGATIALRPPPPNPYPNLDDPRALAFSRIEAHYFIHKGFMREDGQLLHDAHRIAHIPGAIVQGRYDMVTPPVSAFDLKAAWPRARLTVVPDAGHAVSEPGIMSALLDAVDDLAEGRLG